MKYLFLLISAFSFAQQSSSVDFKTIHAAIEINPIKRNVVGQVTYTFELKGKVDTIRVDAQKMVFTNMKINNSKVKFKENKKQLLLFEGFKKGKNTLTFNYEAFPTQAMYFVNWDFNDVIDTPEEVQGQIWTQGQGKNTSNWLPSFDDVNEKVVFGLDIKFQKSFEVISNGALLNKNTIGDDIIWKYKMKQPMSSYLLMVSIAHFEKKQQAAASGIPLYFYFEKEDANKFEPTYRYSKTIFDFLETEIGVPYPWEVYRQVPVRDFLYAGMENTAATTFSRDYVVDSTAFNDRNYVEVNAHELAHQWFGDLVTAQSGKDHWLQEGFATYYALLAQRQVFGDDYFYYKLYNSSQQLMEAAKTDSIPVLNPKASSLTFYQKGAWALHALHEAIGREKFNLAVKNYLTKYAFQNVTTDNFLVEVAAVSDFDTAQFRKTWLEDSKFPAEQVRQLLQANPFITQFMELRQKPLNAITDKEAIISLMRSEVYYPIKELLVFESVSEPFEAKEYILSEAMKTNELHIRQAVAATLVEMPESFRPQYEGLLNDKSYETQEIALYNLWKQFPEQRPRYIELSKDWVGFQEKNLKLQHLSLAFLTENDQKKKLDFYRELLSYTGTNYDSKLQQDALEKLLGLEIYTEDVLRSLVYATGSHRWQFVKFAKDNIRKLLHDQKKREMFVAMRPRLPIREKTQLQRLLEEK